MASVLERETLPQRIKDAVHENVTGLIEIQVGVNQALEIAQDLEFAIEKNPGLSYSKN